MLNIWAVRWVELMKINKKYSFFQQLNISKKRKHSVLSSLKSLLRKGVLISEMQWCPLLSLRLGRCQGCSLHTWQNCSTLHGAELWRSKTGLKSPPSEARDVFISLLCYFKVALSSAFSRKVPVMMGNLIFSWICPIQHSFKEVIIPFQEGFCIFKYTSKLNVSLEIVYFSHLF